MESLGIVLATLIVVFVPIVAFLSFVVVLVLYASSVSASISMGVVISIP
jgi:hypothetical protein